MRRYSTEIVIPEDRFVGLQLPAALPAGRAVVTILIQGAEGADAEGDDVDPDRQDIEWWDEFADEDPADAPRLAFRADRAAGR